VQLRGGQCGRVVRAGDRGRQDDGRLRGRDGGLKRLGVGVGAKAAPSATNTLSAPPAMAARASAPTPWPATNATSGAPSLSAIARAWPRISQETGRAWP
jgi:hypothetical protein